ncbi:DUF3617 domain-containing protein [Ferrigenium kumadai]|nr:DUF3617 family protein [Ferrigenium kumadai]
MAGILAATLAGASFAAEIQPGLWELVVENRGLDSPDVTSEPITISRCLTEEDAQDPSGVLGGVANPGMADCTYTQRSFSGNTFRFKMRCDGSLGLQARGEVTYSAISMDGSIISMANMDGQAIMLESKITARRRGGC